MCLNDSVCRAVVSVPGCFCVSMVPTGADNSSNDHGSTVRDVAVDGARLPGWMCHSFCVCPSPELKVLIGPSSTGSKCGTVFWCELATQPLRMKH